jgi:hypothetical protein
LRSRNRCDRDAENIDKVGGHSENRGEASFPHKKQTSEFRRKENVFYEHVSSRSLYTAHLEPNLDHAVE